MSSLRAAINRSNAEQALQVVLRSARIEQGSYWITEPAVFGKAHRHPLLYHLTFLARGKDRVRISRRMYDVHAGDAILVKPGQAHESLRAQTGTPLELFDVRFSLISRTLPRLPSVMSVQRGSEFAAVFHELLHELHMSRPFRDTALRVHLCRLFLALLQGAKSDLAGSLRRRPETLQRTEEEMRRAMAFIEKNYNRKITLSDIAQHLAISPSKLTHDFREFAKLSPIQYLIRYRLSKAFWLLEHSSHKLETVAAMCGFSDVRYFSRAFRKRYKQPPRRYTSRAAETM